MPITPHGRDRRRRPTVEERRAIFLRADGRCEREGCDRELGVDYHNAHLAARSNGGATNPDNVRAWCVPCNLTNGANDVVAASPVKPRPWQADALTIILERIFQSGVATINAAPGAGKTNFALYVFAALAEARLVERLIVVSPNTAIIGQWKRSASRMRIHLDHAPRDGYLEHPDTCGAIITYQGLPGTAKNHRAQLDQTPTLVVFDEVHHIGPNRAWGKAVTRMVGDVVGGDVYPAAVLNMTGTLFRSGRDKRISTVRYATVLDSNGDEKLEAQADWSITTAELIGDELRPLNVYVYGSEARLMDWRDEVVVTGSLGDLDKQQRTTVLRGLDQSEDWLRGFASEAVRLMNNQLAAINHAEPLKLLYCAASQPAARRAANAINEVTNRDFARLIISDDVKAGKALDDAAKESRPCAIAQVKMATEGFDCPQVSTIAYASNVTADLTITQMVARAMRVTDHERASGRLLPAQILIPDNPDLRSVFASILSTLPRLIDLDETCSWCGEPRPCNCCFRCGQPRPCACPKGPWDPPPRRYELMDLTGPQLQLADVLGHENGEVTKAELDTNADGLSAFGIAPPWHPNALAWARTSYQPNVPRYGEPKEPASTVVVDEPHPRDLNQMWRAKIDDAARWMAQHVVHDDRYPSVGYFQAAASREAFIPKGGRDQAAPKQLRTCAKWMCARIVEHCERHGEVVPPWATPE